MQTSHLNPTQLEAIHHINGPMLLIAGAGSGKTRVVTYRIAHLMKSGVAASEILAVTFTNKAAGEMKERILSLLPPSSFYPLISTFHSLGVKILRESIHHLGYSSQFVIYDEEDANKLLKSCLIAAHVKQEGNLVPTFRSLISKAKNKMLSPESAKNDADFAVQEGFCEVFGLYQERLKASQAVDFDDLLYLCVRLFQEHPEVLRFYQNRWRYLLIDEYQDTNHVQYLMAHLLIQQTHNIFVVGDPDQSIYSWRGANIHNILHFEHDYPGAKVVRLEQNYRSKKNILDAANALIQHNAARYEKNLWSTLGEGESIQLLVANDERHEASFVVEELLRLHTFYRIPFSQMTIFYRTNFQSRVFEDYLLRKRVPYVIVGGISFYQRKEIKDILAFLRMILFDHDFISFERTLNLPKRGIGPVTIEKIRQFVLETERPLLDAIASEEIPFSKNQQLKINEYVSLIRDLRFLKQTCSLQELVIETIRRTEYLNVLKEDKETYDDRKENIDELISKAHEWDLFHPTSALDEFLEELSLKSSLDEAAFSNDRVNLMTLHNGKGLEFAVTFLVGMEEDLFPHANARDNHQSIEEERRLCYVGMTRAKERLYLTAAQNRFLFGTQRLMRPSRFLREIPKEYLTRIK